MASTSAEIIAFLLTISGWVLVSSTLPTDYWKVSTIDGTVITTATFWANLWKTCVTDSTGVSNCKDFPSMLALDGYIQACRGLMISAVCLGFFGAVFGLIGMKCTKVGGSDQTKAKIACLAGLIFILSGLCSMTSCSLYANRITSEFFDPSFVAQNLNFPSPQQSPPRSLFTNIPLPPELPAISDQSLIGLISLLAASGYTATGFGEQLLWFLQPKIRGTEEYELGAALFIGWAGASLCIIGGSIFCFSIAENRTSPRRGYAYNGATSVMSSRTKVPDKTPPKHFDKNAYV